MVRFVPPEIIDEMIHRANIVEIIGNYIPLKKQGRNFVGLCPFHNEDTPSFSVSPEKQIFYCFGCQKGGNALTFIKDMDGLSLPEAAEKLAAMTGVEIPPEQQSPQAEKKISEKKVLYALLKEAANYYERQLATVKGKIARDYLDKRGIREEIREEFSLGFAPSEAWDGLVRHLGAAGFSQKMIQLAGLAGESTKSNGSYDKFRSRLMFPITDYKGQVIAFGGRVLDDSLPKYLNSQETPVFSKSQHLYGFYHAGPHIRSLDAAVVVEGYMDVLSAHNYGVKNVVACLGTAFTADHARLLKRYTNRVYLAYDGDSAGTKATLRALEIMKNLGFQIRILPFPDDMDPDDFLKTHGRLAWENLLAESSLSVLEYKLNLALKQYHHQSPEEKGRIVSQLLPDIARTTNQVERDSFIRNLARTIDVAPETIYADLRKSNLLSPASITYIARSAPADKNKKMVMDDASPPLVALMLSKAVVFEKGKKSLGLHFPKEENLSVLLNLVEEKKDAYSWQPASLLHHIENEEVKQSLLQLLHLELPSGDDEELSDAYIKKIKIQQLQIKIDKISQSLAGVPLDDQTLQLLEALNKLQEEKKLIGGN